MQIGKATNEIERRFITAYPKVLACVFKNQPITISDVQRDVKITYSHTQTCVTDLLKCDLIRRKKKGRIVILSTTEAGATLATIFQKMIPILENLTEKNRNKP